MMFSFVKDNPSNYIYNLINEDINMARKSTTAQVSGKELALTALKGNGSHIAGAEETNSNIYVNICNSRNQNVCSCTTLLMPEKYIAESKDSAGVKSTKQGFRNSIARKVEKGEYEDNVITIDGETLAKCGLKLRIVFTGCYKLSEDNDVASDEMFDL